MVFLTIHEYLLTLASEFANFEINTGAVGAALSWVAAFALGGLRCWAVLS